MVETAPCSWASEGRSGLAAQNSVLVHIARPYASALFDLSVADKNVEAVEADLQALSTLIDESPDFSRFLRSPVIGAEQKAETIDAILPRAGLNPLVGNLVKLVARNGRLFALPAIIADFRERAATARGEVAAEVTSAAPLTAAQLQSLAETLKQKIGKTVTLVERVDPSLIGGLIVKVGSRMIDTSLRTKLTQMKIAMKEVA